MHKFYIEMYAGSEVYYDPAIFRYLLNSAQIKNLANINITKTVLKNKLYRVNGLCNVKTKKNEYLNLKEFDSLFFEKLKQVKTFDSIESLGFAVIDFNLFKKLKDPDYFLNKHMPQISKTAYTLYVQKIQQRETYVF